MCQINTKVQVGQFVQVHHNITLSVFVCQVSMKLLLLFRWGKRTQNRVDLIKSDTMAVIFEMTIWHDTVKKSYMSV